MKIGIINGPNLNLLGKREPHIYGSQTFADYLLQLKEQYPSLQLEYFQSNGEKEIVDALQQMEVDGFVLNAGAFTHTSIAISDALMAIEKPVVEVHISNVYKRENFRHHSYLSPHAKGVIVGFGLKGYQLALESFL